MLLLFIENYPPKGSNNNLCWGDITPLHPLIILIEHHTINTRFIPYLLLNS